MSFALPDILLVMTIVVGLTMIVGFLVVAARGHQPARHPEGPKGRLRDEALRAAPALPYLMLMLSGWAFNGSLDQGVYLWLLGLSVVCGLLAHQVPAVIRARERLRIVEGHPSQ